MNHDGGGIIYDINIDIKILETIVHAKNQATNITELRNTAIGNINVLDKHLANLERWGIINDEKPERNGLARRISLNVPYGNAMDTILRLKKAVETVNEFFNI